MEVNTMKEKDRFWFAKTYGISMFDFSRVFNLGERAVRNYFNDRKSLRQDTIKRIELAFQVLKENENLLPKRDKNGEYDHTIAYNVSVMKYCDTLNILSWRYYCKLKEV
jgi:hypothetical protein